jgi:hypothetical protein
MCPAGTFESPDIEPSIHGFCIGMESSAIGIAIRAWAGQRSEWDVHLVHEPAGFEREPALRIRAGKRSTERAMRGHRQPAEGRSRSGGSVGGKAARQAAILMSPAVGGLSRMVDPA